MNEIETTIIQFEESLENVHTISFWKNNTGGYFQSEVKIGKRTITISEFTLKELLEKIIKTVNKIDK